MIKINPEKAIALVKDKIRLWRDGEFEKNDLAIQNALVEGLDTSELIIKRNYLRDLPNQCEGKSINELTTLLLELNI